MNTNTTKIEEISVYGKKIRTDNKNLGSLVNFWEEFMKKEYKGDVYGVYTNYESDYTGEYDFYIGIYNDNNEEKVDIQEGEYLTIEVDAKDPQGLAKAWNYIWNSDIKRTYKTDFEYYSKDGSIKIYLSI
ncbi:GyrI-like domain-containing protein [Metaclostridioides mangenotii]|uniref:GyrI-like domain-containing protein n=1 Tax=Metaclostridioides mangenotii TaxID=1540 RepID=UPI0026F21144|nr:effector binding domain-containing protein [Clostridioides mangenotii]